MRFEISGLTKVAISELKRQNPVKFNVEFWESWSLENKFC